MDWFELACNWIGIRLNLGPFLPIVLVSSIFVPQNLSVVYGTLNLFSFDFALQNFVFSFCVLLEVLFFAPFCPSDFCHHSPHHQASKNRYGLLSDHTQSDVTSNN